MGEHTQLNGAVIASKADPSKNRLDTGTIGFTDIENKAEYDVSSISGSVGVSKGQGSGGFSPTSGQPTIYDHNDEASNITHAAISDGELIIRDQDKQTQDINELSHDTENAHSKLKPIFNKEDEQTRLNIVTSLKELGEQVKELERTIHKDADKDSQDGKMGNDFSKGVDSAVSIITSIITGDITGGLAGASAPWLAEQIKLHTGHLDKDGKWQTDDIASNLIAHAILGAVVAELQGNSGLAGGTGAVIGESAAWFISEKLYGKKVEELTESEKENMSALAQLATGFAVAAGGGSVGDAGAAISSSKNAVENNYGDYVGYAFYNASKTKCGDDPECINKTTMEIMQGQKEFMDKYGKPIIIAEAAALTLPALISVLPESAIIGGTISGGGNAAGQYLTTGKVNINDTIIWTGVGMFTGGYGTGLWGTTGWGIAGGATSSYLKDENPIMGGLIGGSSSFVGYGAGKLVENPLQSWFNPVANKYIHETNRGFLGITGHYTESSIPSVVGTTVNSSVGEIVGNRINESIGKKNENK